MPALPSLPAGELRGFLAALHAAGPDDEPALVFADWLDDHADPRAELLRLQLRIAAALRDGDDLRAGPLRDRERAWLTEWAGVWPPVPFLRAERGVLRGVAHADLVFGVADRPELRATLACADWIDLTIIGLNDTHATILAADLSRHPVGRVTLRAGYRHGAATLPSRFSTVSIPTPSECLTPAGLSRLADVLAEWDVTVIDDAPLGPVGRLPGLRRLALPDTVIDSALSAISGAVGLRELDLKGCHRITGVGLRHLTSHTDLRVLRLDECRHLDDAALASLQPLVGLRELYLPFCRRITAAGLRHLRGLVGLEVLDLGFVRGLTDDALTEVAALPSLRHLHLFFCDSLTDAGLRRLHGHPSLRAISLGKCDRLTERGLAALRRSLPRLVISR